MVDIETEGGVVVLALRSFVAAIVQVFRYHSTSGLLVATRVATDPCDAKTLFTECCNNTTVPADNSALMTLRELRAATISLEGSRFSDACTYCTEESPRRFPIARCLGDTAGQLSTPILP